MIRHKIGHLMAASALVFAFTASGVGAMAVLGANTPTPGTDLATDIQTGQAGDKITAEDVDTAEEVDVDNGEVEQLDEIDNGNTSASANTSQSK
jgi:hypothetical protein